MLKGFKQFTEEVVNPVVFTFGRFNPPTIGHLKLLDKVASIARGKNYRIYASQSEDSKKNPLQYSEKVRFMRKMFPRHGRNIVMDANIKTVFDIAVKLYDEGFNQLNMVVGDDRVNEFERLLIRYNDQKGRHGYYNFIEGINIISAGRRDPDSEGVEGMSASKMRAAAVDKDFKSFQQGLPKGYSDGVTLFNTLRKRMGLREVTDFRNHIQLDKISEKRELYTRGEIFNIGEQAVTQDGQTITISERKPNYIVAGDGNKYWINDLTEVKKQAQDKDIKGRKGSQPANYHRGLKKSTKVKRDAQFKKQAKMRDDDPSAYKPAPGDKGAKTKPSKHTKKYKQMFGEGPEDDNPEYYNEALRYNKIYHASSKKISRPSTHPMFFALALEHSKSDNFEGWYYNLIQNDGQAYLYEAQVGNKNKVAKYDDRKIQQLFTEAGIDLEEVYINMLLANPSGKEIQNDPGTKLLQKNGYIGIQYLDYDPRDFSKDLEALIIFNPSRDTRGFKLISASNESVEIDEKKNPRIPRKKGQPAGSDKHSDLYTDENPKGTIKGLGFKDTKTAEESIRKIKNSGKSHAHKIQAAIAMEQRARVMGKTGPAAVYRKYINQMKKKTKERNEDVQSFKEYLEVGTNTIVSTYKKETPGEEEIKLEKLDPRKHDAGDYIDDFLKSDAPQFKGKSKKEIQNMAIAAYLQARDDAGLTENGLWANIHKRRKSGKRMRKPGEKGAPTKAAFKSASENVEEGTGKKKKSEPWPKQYERRVVKTTKPEHKEKGFNWRIKGKERNEISIKLYKTKPSYQEFVKQMKRVAGHEFGG